MQYKNNHTHFKRVTAGLLDLTRSWITTNLDKNDRNETSEENNSSVKPKLLIMAHIRYQE